MSRKDYSCTCNQCGHNFVSHENFDRGTQIGPVVANCTRCGKITQNCKKI